MSVSIPTDLKKELSLGSPSWRKKVKKEHYRIISESFRNFNWSNKLSSTASSLLQDGIASFDFDLSSNPSYDELTKLVLLDRLREFNDMDSQKVNSVAFRLLPDTSNLILSILSEIGIVDLVKCYFNSSELNYDICGLDAVQSKSIANLSTIDGSGFWHRDSTGIQIKVFICILRIGNGVQLQYLKSSHHNQPITEQWEMIRAYKNDNPDSTLNFTNYMTQENSSSLESVDLLPGQLCIFDTNGIHRGNYLGNKTDSLNRRIVISTTFCSQPNHSFFNELNGINSVFSTI